jgi:hypothetical protein
MSEELPDKITIGDKYGAAMKITEQAEADEYYERCVRHTMRFGRTREEAENVEKQNLGYYAGYYDSETRERVERLFRCAHPVFGSIAQNGPPTSEQAFAAGVARGSQL